jgi:hypothetical protein
VEKSSEAYFSEWSEAYVLETRGQPIDYETIIKWGNSWLRSVDSMVRPGTMTAHENLDIRLAQYINAAPLYTRRESSYQSNVVLAFGDIINKIWLAEDQSAMLKHGLPMKSLPMALIWEATDPGQMTRRAIKCATDHVFLSWSWASWVGPITYPLTFYKKLKNGWTHKPGRRNLAVTKSKANPSIATQLPTTSPIPLHPFFSLEHVGLDHTVLQCRQWGEAALLLH